MELEVTKEGKSFGGTGDVNQCEWTMDLPQINFRGSELQKEDKTPIDNIIEVSDDEEEEKKGSKDTKFRFQMDFEE